METAPFYLCLVQYFNLIKRNWLGSSAQAHGFSRGLLTHETTHLYDNKRLGNFLYAIGYAFPQILVLPALLLLFLSWKIALIVAVLCLLPFPAPWRTYFEKRAYFVQLYARYSLWSYGAVDTMQSADEYEDYFANGDYYFMWWPMGLMTEFSDAANQLSNGQNIITDTTLKTMVDDLVAAAKL